MGCQQGCIACQQKFLSLLPDGRKWGLAGDGGIDAISARKREVRLIQCKHTLWGASVDTNVIAEMISAFDSYRARWLRSLIAKPFIYPVLVTNGGFTSKARKEAKERDIHLMDESDLWRLLDATPCTPADIEAMEGRRLPFIKKPTRKILPLSLH